MRIWFSLAQGLMLLAVFLILPPPAGAAGDWWDETFPYRFPLKISNRTEFPLPSGYTAAVSFDHASLVGAGLSRADGADLRIVYFSAGKFQELDRRLAVGSDWDRSGTTVVFKTQTAIEGADDSYFIYFGNLEAVDPPQDPRSVFAFYQDFEALAVGEMPPEWRKFGNDQEMKAEVSEDEAFSGRKSLKLSGSGWALSAYRPSPIGKDYTASIWYKTLDQAHEGGLYFRADLSNQFHPAWVFQMGDWWYAGGGYDNRRVPLSLPKPEPDRWTRLEVKVVGSEVVSLAADGETGFRDLPTDWEGDYLGVSFRGTKLVYYDDLALKKAVREEPRVEVGSRESKPASWVRLSVEGESGLHFDRVRPLTSVVKDLVLKVESDQPLVWIWAESTSPLSRSDGGRIISPWDGEGGFGYRLKGRGEFKPLTGKTLLYETDAFESSLDLPLEIILRTTYLDPPGDYRASLKFLVEAPDDGI
jgi:hypothetical protein